MKKIGALIILLLLPVVSAIEFDMKTTFDQGETLMAKISGNFITPILKENIEFYRGHVRIPMNYDLARINDDFYIYASLLGKTQNNYSIVIKDAAYMQGAQIIEDEITKDFVITNSTADFLIDLGFAIASDSFSIKVQNLQDTTLTIQIRTKSAVDEEDFFASLFGSGISGDTGSYSVTLKSGEVKTLDFNINNVTSSALKILELSTTNLNYNIPIYVLKTIIPDDKKVMSLKFDPAQLNISVVTNSNKIQIIHLYNTGETILENISLSVSDSLEPYVLFPINEIKELAINSSVKIELYVFSGEEEIVEGNMKARVLGESGSFYTYASIILNFLPDYIPLEEESEEQQLIDLIQKTKTCEELMGKICVLGKEECSGQTISAKDDLCCMDKCEEIKKSSKGKIIGWGIVGFLIVFLVWFFKTQYRGAKKEINLFKIAKGRR